MFAKHSEKPATCRDVARDSELIRFSLGYRPSPLLALRVDTFSGHGVMTDPRTDVFNFAVITTTRHVTRKCPMVDNVPHNRHLMSMFDWRTLSER